MRTKQYTAAVRARDGALLLTIMRVHEDVRPTKPIPTGGRRPTPRSTGSIMVKR